MTDPDLCARCGNQFPPGQLCDACQHCWPCLLLGRWQHGPLYWLLRWHLHHA
jgi:hypothetical protein